MKIKIKDKKEAEQIALVLISNNYYVKLNENNFDQHSCTHPHPYDKSQHIGNELEIMGLDREKSGTLLNALNEMSDKIDNLQLDKRDKKMYKSEKTATKIEELRTELSNERSEIRYMDEEFRKMKLKLSDKISKILRKFRDLESEL